MNEPPEVGMLRHVSIDMVRIAELSYAADAVPGADTYLMQRQVL
jgi:hypothetical protein